MNLILFKNPIIFCLKFNTLALKMNFAYNQDEQFIWDGETELVKKKLLNICGRLIKKLFYQFEHYNISVIFCSSFGLSNKWGFVSDI